MDTGTGDLRRPPDCYAGYSQFDVQRRTAQGHSIGSLATSGLCPCLSLIADPAAGQSIPRKAQSKGSFLIIDGCDDIYDMITAINDEKAPLALSFPWNGQQPSPVLAACWLSGIVALSPALT